MRTTDSLLNKSLFRPTLQLPPFVSYDYAVCTFRLYDIVLTQKRGKCIYRTVFTFRVRATQNFFGIHSLDTGQMNSRGPCSNASPPQNAFSRFQLSKNDCKMFGLASLTTHFMHARYAFLSRCMFAFSLSLSLARACGERREGARATNRQTYRQTERDFFSALFLGVVVVQV